MDDGLPIHTFLEVRSPENTRDAVRVIEAFGVMKLSLRIYFVIAAKVRPDDDGRVWTEVWIRLDPIEQSANSGICRAHYTAVFRKTLMTDVVRHLAADDHSRPMLLQDGGNSTYGLNERIVPFEAVDHLGESGIVRRDSIAMIFFKYESVFGNSPDVGRERRVFVIVFFPRAAINDQNDMFGPRGSSAAAREKGSRTQGLLQKPAPIH
jgi:hypothetical protein